MLIREWQSVYTNLYEKSEMAEFSHHNNEFIRKKSEMAAVSHHNILLIEIHVIHRLNYVDHWATKVPCDIKHILGSGVIIVYLSLVNYSMGLWIHGIDDHTKCNT